MRDRPPTIFISYSHKDRHWLERLDTFLAPVKRTAEITIWNDTQTPPGADWRREIETHLQTCDAAILIITAHFFASDFIDEQELPPLLDAAERRGVEILPLIAGHSRFQRSPLDRWLYFLRRAETLHAVPAPLAADPAIW